MTKKTNPEGRDCELESGVLIGPQNNDSGPALDGTEQEATHEAVVDILSGENCHVTYETQQCDQGEKTELGTGLYATSYSLDSLIVSAPRTAYFVEGRAEIEATGECVSGDITVKLWGLEKQEEIYQESEDFFIVEFQGDQKAKLLFDAENGELQVFEGKIKIRRNKDLVIELDEGGHVILDHDEGQVVRYNDHVPDQAYSDAQSSASETGTEALSDSSEDTAEAPLTTTASGCESAGSGKKGVGLAAAIAAILAAERGLRSRKAARGVKKNKKKKLVVKIPKIPKTKK